jgi:hypothetical protein
MFHVYAISPPLSVLLRSADFRSTVDLSRWGLLRDSTRPSEIRKMPENPIAVEAHSH